MKHHIIDTLDLQNLQRYRAREGQRINIPRLKNVTQIIAGKVHPNALAHYSLAYEPLTEKPGPDYEPAPPQLDEQGKPLPLQWQLRTYTQEQIDAHRSMVLDRIDSAVEQWRIARTSPGNYITAEYEIKREDAAAYRAAIITQPDAAVPVTIQAVADRYQITPQAAAQTIIGRAAILPAELRASAVVRDEQKGKAARAEDIAKGADPDYVPASHEIIATLDQILTDTHTKLAQIPTS